jgi:hypothetical protein
MPEIEVDEDVLEALKSDAEPFVDTPNTVLRRRLGLDTASSPSLQSARTSSRSHAPPRDQSRAAGQRRGKKRSRAPKGSLLPEEAYEVPILQVLDEGGGRAPTREVVDAVGRIVESRLTKMDKEEMEKGLPRWRNRVQFTRLRLVERGWLASNSPRGVWEITDQGLAALRQATGDKGER